VVAENNLNLQCKAVISRSRAVAYDSPGALFSFALFNSTDEENLFIPRLRNLRAAPTPYAMREAYSAIIPRPRTWVMCEQTARTTRWAHPRWCNYKTPPDRWILIPFRALLASCGNGGDSRFICWEIKIGAGHHFHTDLQEIARASAVGERRRGPIISKPFIRTELLAYIRNMKGLSSVSRRK